MPAFEGTATGPTYISSRSADVILSDVRPIKLAYEALQAVNVLLDELLYTILGVARSLFTDNLKTALLKVLPTNLGKEALLEAEVELKAYWERTTTSTSGTGNLTGENGGPSFDLQWSFELLRLKCEAYTTMNDSDEDADAEARLRERMEDSGASVPPNASEVAPAALYLTAILEYICEHILSNVSSVAARDSSRTIATVQDVFVALCEDDTMYGTFRGMKVYDQIEELTRAQRPRRSKSFSRNSDRVSSPTPTTSTHAELVSLRESAATPARLRMSTESLRSSTSMEKGRAMKKKFMSHSRSSSEKESVAEMARAPSEPGKSRGSADFEDDEDLLHEFDELMRAGGTTKVSLTPDRLKSMEVYNKERTQRANRRGTQQAGQISAHARDSDAPKPSSPHQLRQRAPSSARPPLRHVDSIIEDEEESHHTTSVSASTRSTSSTPAVRTRQSSKSFSSKSTPAASVRTRSISISDMPHPRHENVSRSSSMSTQAQPSSPATGTGSRSRVPQGSVNSHKSSGMPPRTRRVGRNRELLDLDEIMGKSDEETDAFDVDEIDERATPVPRTTPTSPNGQRGTKPHISQAARDLIAFLDEGPPEEEFVQPRTSMANASMISIESSKSRSGRFSRMMSRLTIGGSTERLNGRDENEIPKTPKTPRMLGRKPSMNNFPPPPAYKAPSLSSKKSFPNVIVSPARASPTPITPAALVSSPVLSQPAPFMISPSMTTSSPTATMPPPLPRSLSATPSQASTDESQGVSPRRSSVRKAVPAFDDKGEPRPPVPPLSLTAESDTPSRDGSVRSQLNGARARAESSPVKRERGSGKAVARDRMLSIETSAPSAVNGHAKTPSPKGSDEEKAAPITPLTPRRSPVPRKPAPSPVENESPPVPSPTTSTTAGKRRSKGSSSKRTGNGSITSSAVADLRRLLSSATNADECRLLVDMFFTKHGFPYGAVAVDASDFPSPPPLDDAKLMTLSELECSLVELFLGGGDAEDLSERKLDTLTEASPDEIASFCNMRDLAQSATDDTLVEETASSIVTVQA